jgi:putative transposase
VSKLKGLAKWTYFYLYVILDVFSRYVVGRTVQHRETAQLAKALIEQATEQQQITSKILTLHADRGGPMRSKPVAFLLADLGVTKTHSRPYTSTDNPSSESNFKTLKYRPEFPERFEDIEHARAHCRAFFHWHNHTHRHSGIALMTPDAMHRGQARELHASRARVLQAAYTRNLERFVRKAPNHKVKVHTRSDAVARVTALGLREANPITHVKHPRVGQTRGQPWDPRRRADRNFFFPEPRVVRRS